MDALNALEVQNYLNHCAVQFRVDDTGIHSFLMVKYLYITVKIYLANIWVHSSEFSIFEPLPSMISYKRFQYNIVHCCIDETTKNINWKHILEYVAGNKRSK